ncbi:MAG: deoxyribodipyrimidine photo-lyase, partial [Bacteroidetes bacterium]
MPFAVHWFRRDLRLDDNTALFHALRSGFPVLPVFIFDREILDLLPAADARVDFIHRTLSDLRTQLQSLGSDLVLRYGKPEEVWQELMQSIDIQAVYTNHDYEPYARSRDPQIAALLAAKGFSFHTFRDQVLFEKTEVLSGSNSPY